MSCIFIHRHPGIQDAAKTYKLGRSFSHNHLQITYAIPGEIFGLKTQDAAKPNTLCHPEHEHLIVSSFVIQLSWQLSLIIYQLLWICAWDEQLHILQSMAKILRYYFTTISVGDCFLENNLICFFRIHYRVFQCGSELCHASSGPSSVQYNKL